VYICVVVCFLFFLKKGMVVFWFHISGLHVSLLQQKLLKKGELLDVVAKKNIVA
jgi:hypothetical protein